MLNKANSAVCTHTVPALLSGFAVVLWHTGTCYEHTGISKYIAKSYLTWAKDLNILKRIHTNGQ
jgi:hypothetical protein